MRRSLTFFIAILMATLLSADAAEDSARQPDDPQTDAAIRELVRRGAVVKRFIIRELKTAGLLVRLKAEHLNQAGMIDSHILLALQPLNELAIELRGLRFSDAGLKSLLANVMPVGLDVSGSEISDHGLLELAGARSRLRLLDVSFTHVGDCGLNAVALLSELRHLSLIGCQVTDCGTEPLTRLRQLHELYLVKTAVSTQAAEQLRLRLPTCRIER